MRPILPALDPATLGMIARCLVLTGNYVAAIGVDRMGVIALTPAATWDIAGGFDPNGWRYHLDLAGPSRSTTRRLPAEGAIHIRIGATTSQPWLGVSPLISAGLTADTLASIERSTKQEAGVQTGILLPIPEGLSDPVIATLKADLAALNGRVALVETSANALGQGRANAPSTDWQPRKFGPEFSQYNVAMRTEVGNNVAQSMGIPSGLYSGADGGTLRESYRQLLTATVQPWATVVIAELSKKLERVFRFGFSRLQAADIAARARAYNSLIQAGVDPADAMVLAGLGE